MLRALVLLLLLADIGFAAWSHGLLRGAGLGPATGAEPLRLSQQQHPERLRVIGPGRAADAAPPAPTAVASAAASAAAPQARASQPRASATQ